MANHCEDMIKFLFDEDIEFSILTPLANIEFNPVLPKDIISEFKPITLFTLAGYTYESAKLDENILSFEAGFGKENFGSYVSVPSYAILQIIVENTPIFINLAIPPEEQINPKKEISVSKGVEKSMDIFLSNPNNKKLLKTKKI